MRALQSAIDSVLDISKDTWLEMATEKISFTDLGSRKAHDQGIAIKFPLLYDGVLKQRMEDVRCLEVTVNHSGASALWMDQIEQN